MESGKSWYLNVVLGVLTLCAIVTTGLQASRLFWKKPSNPDPTKITPDLLRHNSVSDWKSYSEEGHWNGPKDAQVVLVVFSDFQCPFCREAELAIRAVQRENKGNLAIVFRHFPLSMHPFARAAAGAAECAGEQGRFSEMEAQLFDSQRDIGTLPWVGFAVNAAIPDSLQFLSCVRNNRMDSILRRDSLAARRLGIRGTPTILVNQYRFTGPVSAERLEEYINYAMKNGPAT